MTIKEFWGLKYGQIVGKENSFKGKVIKRKVYDEVTGFIMTKSKTIDLKSGRKYLEITLDCGENGLRYIQSNMWNLDKFQIYKE